MYSTDHKNHIRTQYVSPFPRFMSESELIPHLCCELLRQGQTLAGKDRDGLWPGRAHSQAQGNYNKLDSTSPRNSH